MPAARPDLTEPLTLAWFTLGDPNIVEIAMRGIADIAVMDLQHGIWDRLSAHAAVQAASPRPAFMRVADNTAIEISRGLDTGAAGVIVPMVETAEEAAEAIRHAHFPPSGHRSAGGVRLQALGLQYTAPQARALLGVMIETATGVRNADAIAATEGLDFIFIGPGDLSLSLGGDLDALERGLATIRAACRKHGMPCGIFTLTRAISEKRRSEGFSITVIGDDVGAIIAGFS